MCGRVEFMRRKIVIGLLCLTMTAALLTGCGGNEGNVDEDVEMAYQNPGILVAAELFPKESMCVKI